MTNVIADLGNSLKRDDVPDFRAGDNIKVHVKVIEGSRSRVQVFQGVVIRIHGSGIGRTFTVRKVSFGVGVERTFPLNSPIFDIAFATGLVGPAFSAGVSQSPGSSKTTTSPRWGSPPNQYDGFSTRIRSLRISPGSIDSDGM